MRRKSSLKGAAVQGINRRSFLKVAGAASAAALAGARVHALTTAQTEITQSASANDHIQIALIGAGGQGQGDTRTAVQVPGVKLVAVADCYNGRLEHSKEIWGNDLFTTRDYREPCRMNSTGWTRTRAANSIQRNCGNRDLL